VPVVIRSIHPPGPRVGTGGRTCSRPTSPHARQRTLIGRRHSLYPAATIAARSSTCQRSQRGQYARSSWLCSCRPAMVPRSIMGPTLRDTRLKA
jgi:hypothetical protein